MTEKKHSHFQGKKPLEHVIEARQKGRIATAEIHGAELPGHFHAAADAAKETGVVLLLLWTILDLLHIDAPQNYLCCLFFLLGYLIWKVGRSAILGYSRIERLHRLIEEEKWEIEHHRIQEKEELKALYQAKGFSGKLLDEVIDVLMADDNRLLQVMLEEELGVNLESYEHPLKQATGALIGVFGSAAILSFGVFFLPFFGTVLTGGLIIALSAGTSAQLERNKALPAIVWNLSVAGLSILIAYFTAKIFA